MEKRWVLKGYSLCYWLSKLSEHFNLKRQYEISAIHFRFIFRMPTSRGCDWYMGLPQWLISKECACQCRRHGFDPWVRKIPWRRKWQPTPAFLPRKYHGQRSLVGNSPGVTNSWTRLSAHTWACTHTHTHTHTLLIQLLTRTIRCKRARLDPKVRKILWSRKWQPTPVFLPEKFHGQKSLVGYSPWGHKELDMSEWLSIQHTRIS